MPPYQPYYLPYELPKDDMFVPQEKIQTVIQAKPTVHEFIPLNDGTFLKLNLKILFYKSKFSNNILLNALVHQIMD